MNTTTCGATAAIWSQVTRTDGAPGQARTASAPANCSIPGTQWPPLNGGSPLQREHPGPRQPLNRGLEPGEPLAQLCDELVGSLLGAGGLADLQHAVQDLVQRAGIQRDDLGLAAENVQGLVDLAGGDCADRTQVLSQHQVGGAGPRWRRCRAGRAAGRRRCWR
jgi:hypothetical protein